MIDTDSSWFWLVTVLMVMVHDGWLINWCHKSWRLSNYRWSLMDKRPVDAHGGVSNDRHQVIPPDRSIYLFKRDKPNSFRGTHGVLPTNGFGGVQGQGWWCLSERVPHLGHHWGDHDHCIYNGYYFTTVTRIIIWIVSNHIIINIWMILNPHEILRQIQPFRSDNDHQLPSHHSL